MYFGFEGFRKKNRLEASELWQMSQECELQRKTFEGFVVTAEQRVCRILIYNGILHVGFQATTNKGVCRIPLSSGENGVHELTAEEVISMTPEVFGKGQATSFFFFPRDGRSRRDCEAEGDSHF